MRRIAALIMTLMLLMLNGVSCNAQSDSSFYVEFNDVISLSLSNNGQVEEITKQRVSYHPEKGGWFLAEVLIPSEELPGGLTADNEQQVLKQCVDRMSESFDEIWVPRQDIVRIGETTLFHTQDVSFSAEPQYLILSDGFLFFTAKGIVALWFSSDPLDRIEDAFMSSVLASVRTMTEGESGQSSYKPLFSQDDLSTIMAEEKRHFQLLESDERLQHLSPVPFDSSLSGSAVMLTSMNVPTKEWMRSEENRTKFSAVALFEAGFIDRRLLNIAGNQGPVYTGRKSDTVIAVFAFAEDRVLIIEYDEKAGKVTGTVSEHGGDPVDFLESLKKKHFLLSYYKNDLKLLEQSVEEFAQFLSNSVQTADDGLSQRDAPMTEAPLTRAGGEELSFRETMDSLEAFMDEYTAFMKRFRTAKDTLSLMADYGRFVAEYAEATQKMMDIDESALSPADQAYYLEVMLRINQKLAQAAGE